MRCGKAGEIEMVRREQVARAEIADVRALAGRQGAERKSVVGLRLRADMHHCSVDAVLVGKSAKELSFHVVADECDRGDRQRGIELADVDRHVAARPAAAHVGAKDFGAPVHLRPVVEKDVAVDAPGAAGQNASTCHRARLSGFRAARRSTPFIQKSRQGGTKTAPPIAKANPEALNRALRRSAASRKVSIS